jgi:hypothetical protein
MAGKSNTSATFFAQKKLLGKAHTSNLKTDGEELIGSNIQSSTNLLFGESIPDSPTRTLNLIQSASQGAPGTVEYIQFALEVLTGSTYNATNTGGGAGSDSGEDSQSSGPHSYKFKLPSDYTSISSNPRKGNGVFDNGKIVHQTLGSLQLVPPFYSQTAPNPYIIKIYKDDGAGGVGSEIPLLDNIDWNVDYYNGMLFLQDYDASKIPAHARAFAYIGKMAAEVISSGSSGGGGGTGNGDGDAQYLVLSSTGSLSNERVFTVGTGLSSNDAGANGNFTVGVNDSVVATLTSSVSFSNGISGSLTQLSDGTSYLVAGSNVTITSASNGQVTISSPDIDAIVTVANGSDNRIATFSSSDALNGESNLTFDGTTFTVTGDTFLDGAVVVNESGSDKDFRVESNNKQNAIFVDGGTDQVLILSGGAATSINEAEGADVNFFVSGSVDSRSTSVRGTSLFGGDLAVSGTLAVNLSDSGA